MAIETWWNILIVSVVGLVLWGAGFAYGSNSRDYSEGAVVALIPILGIVLAAIALVGSVLVK